MLTLQIDGADLNELRLKAMKALCLAEVLPVAQPAPSQAEIDAASAKVAQVPLLAEPTAEATAPRRGRPRGSGKQTAPVSEASAGVHTAEKSEPQAAVGNTADAPAVLDTSAAEGVAAGAAEVAPPVSFEQMKGALQSLLDSKLGSADGMSAATRILNDLNYAKVREVKPEHYGTVVERVKAVLAA